MPLKIKKSYKLWKLEELKKELGLTNTQLAKELGSSPASISRILNGQKIIPLDHAKKLFLKYDAVVYPYSIGAMGLPEIVLSKKKKR